MRPAISIGLFRRSVMRILDNILDCGYEDPQALRALLGELRAEIDSLESRSGYYGDEARR